MVKKIKSRLHQFWLATKIFKAGDFFYILLDGVLNREKVRQISIDGTSFVVRTNTPDISVAVSSFYHKEYEPIRCLNPKVIVDAGANIGTSAIFFAKKYPEALVVSIEPEESNYDLLTRNTENYKNIVTIKAALWGVKEERTIKNRFTGHWGYTVSDTPNLTEMTGQKIQCVTMESVMEAYGIEAIDILKMDIEGGEKHVLEHSKGWIDSVKILTAELHERICPGCEKAFYIATKGFTSFEKHNEKVTAYRN